MQQQALLVGAAAPVLLAEPGQDGVLIQADPENGTDIFIGAQNVTADATATGGIRLTPGTAIRLVNGPSDYIWAIAPIAGQVVRILYPLADAIVELYASSPAASLVPNVFKQLNAVVITAETTIWTPAAGKRFRFLGFQLAQGVATGTVVFKDNTAGPTIWTMGPAPLGSPIDSPPMGDGILSAAANNVLTATGVATETLTGVVFGTEE